MLFYLWQAPLKKARRAARLGQWERSAAAYHLHLARYPHDGAAWVQLGHSLKEHGDLAAAVKAYRQAALRLSSQEDIWIHLAHLERRMGRREAAITALEQALSVEADAHVNGVGRAGQAMVEMGARERLPLSIQRRIEARSGEYALSRYTAWAAAQAEVVTPLPAGFNVLAVIDARGAPPDLVAVTRKTLGKTDCLIVGDSDASGSCLRAGESVCAAASDATHFVLVEAGARITPTAIAQLSGAVTATGAGAAYSDHDHWMSSEQGITFADPCFQPMADPLWFRRSAVRPPCLLLTAEAAAAVPNWATLFAQSMTLPVRHAHVPLILASRWSGTVPTDLKPIASRIADAGFIQVVIQTRDAPDMLARCVDSLRRTAAYPDRLDIVIVDNRSVLPETATLLGDWSARGIARIVPHDEPFNWARANNLAVRLGEAPNLLFLNNDVEMESVGWDSALRDGLAMENAGALGALLLYPDRSIQHAGVIFGMANGGAVHEGVACPAGASGPSDRWQYPRLAAAVTGAWLSVSRALFEAIGGFEERLPVSYNDIDFCLRCRAAGRYVVQASNIVAIHRESATRGSVTSTAEHARDQANWAWLRTRWGAALDLDPGYNPNWCRTGQPFDGLRIVPPEAMAEWVVASARADPWIVTASSER